MLVLSSMCGSWQDHWTLTTVTCWQIIARVGCGLMTVFGWQGHDITLRTLHQLGIIIHELNLCACCTLLLLLLCRLRLSPHGPSMECIAHMLLHLWTIGNGIVVVVVGGLVG